MDYFFMPMVDDKEISKEREKARQMRKTRWWKEKISKGECYYCGNIVKPADLTMDHVVPVIRGGKSTKGNLVPACKECNNAKKHKLPIEWEEYLENIRKKDI